MKPATGIRITGTSALLVVLALVPAAGKPRGRDSQAKTRAEIPAAVLQAIQDNAPGAEIETAVVEENAGVKLYDIEFKGDRGEIEVAEDGTVIDVSVVVRLQDVPKQAADALRKIAAQAKAAIRRVEKAEVRAEVQIQDGKGRVVRLATPRYVFEAELVRGREIGEVAVDPGGKIVEELKWEKGEEKSMAGP